LSAEGDFRIGIDIGGTFTDVCALDAKTGKWFGLKTPTTSENLVNGVLEGIRLAGENGVAPSEIKYFVHGTTFGVNTIIQRSGANAVLLVTEGFQDLLEFARLRLPVPWSFFSQRTPALIPRDRVVPVRERMLQDGHVDLALTEAEITRVLDVIRSLGADEVAICLLHSYSNDEHENQLKRAILDSGLDAGVSCSAELWPQIREYERAMVTLMNAYVRPPMAGYLDNLGSALAEAGVLATAYVTRSNGGIMTLPTAREQPVQTLLSGPASGIMGAVKVASEVGIDTFVTLDVGGTSADVAVVREGSIEYGTEERIGDYPFILPAVGVTSIGEGGGSIAWVDSGRALRVGPRSAGASPGPASYGLGGTDATLTDAFLLAGYLDSDRFAGGRRLDVNAAMAVLSSLADPLGLSLRQTSDAIIRVALATMYTELSAVFERRGVDPREFALIAFGGAGPVVGCLVAQELHIPTVLIPSSPGTLCAFGALHANIMADLIWSANIPVDSIASDDFQNIVKQLQEEGLDWLSREGPSVVSSEVQYVGDMRYLGQSYEIQVPLPHDWLIGKEVSTIRGAFDQAHERIYAHSDPSAIVEMVNLRARAVGLMEQPASQGTQLQPSEAPAKTRAVWIDGHSYEAVIIDRAQLDVGTPVEGPAVVQQADTTCLVPPGWSGHQDDHGNLILKRK
jgi:N-methylhydantoinase A